MFLVRDVFHCKPGQAKVLAEKFKSVIPSVEKFDGFRGSRVMTDFVADYWTVVVENEVESLESFEAHSRNFSQRPEVRSAMAGYMDLVDGGHREIYRLL